MHIFENVEISPKDTIEFKVLNLNFKLFIKEFESEAIVR